MIAIRPAHARGTANHGWLDSRHSFSFGHYYDPNHMGFGPLRVINEDRVQPGAGFGTHGHSDMEIISYVLEGALEHKDSIGTGSVIRPGDVQRMSAGTGIRHSEFNHSKSEPVHFLQIWLLPEKQGLPPGYEQKTFADGEKRGQLRLVASRDGRDGSLVVHQDADIYASLLNEGEQVKHALRTGRRSWLQIARGAADVNGQALRAGDGAAVEGEPALTVTATSERHRGAAVRPAVSPASTEASLRPQAGFQEVSVDRCRSGSSRRFVRGSGTCDHHIWRSRNERGTGALMPDQPPPVPAREGSALSPFRHWAFAVLWTATVVSNVGTWMQNAAASWLMTGLDPDPLTVALVQVATTLPMFVFALPAGALADIVDRRRLLLVIQIAMALWVAGFGLLVSSGRVTPAILLGFSVSRGNASPPSSHRRGSRSCPAWCSGATCKPRWRSTASGSTSAARSGRRWPG